MKQRKSKQVRLLSASFFSYAAISIPCCVYDLSAVFFCCVSAVLLSAHADMVKNAAMQRAGINIVL